MTKLNFSKVGGHDIGPILGLSPWGGPLEKWQRLALGIRSELPEHAQERAEWGNILEAPVADTWITKTEPDRFDEWRPGVSREPADPDWIRYTIDRERPGALLEVKTTSAYSRGNWGKPGTDEIPIYYATQVHWYLYHERQRLRRLADPAWPPPSVCYVAVLIGGQELLSYSLAADDDLGSKIFEKVAEWRRRYVLTQTAPPIDGSTGARDYLAGLYRKLSGTVRLADTAEAARLNEVVELRAQKKAIENKIALAENLIIESIAADDGIETLGGDGKIRATYRRPKPARRMNWKTATDDLEREIPAERLTEIIETHTTTSDPARRLDIRTMAIK